MSKRSKLQEENIEDSDRDQQILRRLTNIENKVDSLEQTNAFALRADVDRHTITVKKIFNKSLRRAQVYLAANGNRSVLEIADLLKMKQPNVTDDLKILQDEGLLEVIEQAGNRVYYSKKPIDRTIGITKILMKDFNLDRNGLKLK